MRLLNKDCYRMLLPRVMYNLHFIAQGDCIDLFFPGNSSVAVIRENCFFSACEGMNECVSAFLSFSREMSVCLVVIVIVKFQWKIKTWTIATIVLVNMSVHPMGSFRFLEESDVQLKRKSSNRSTRSFLKKMRRKKILPNFKVLSFSGLIMTSPSRLAAHGFFESILTRDRLRCQFRKGKMAKIRKIPS